MASGIGTTRGTGDMILHLHIKAELLLSRETHRPTLIAKGIRFIVLYPPKRSHDLPLAKWYFALLLTARSLSLLPGFQSLPGHLRLGCILVIRVDL